MSTATEPTVLMGGVQPCLTLIPRSKSDVDETELIEFTLKLRAGSGTNAPTYKRKVARFNGGSPADWIEVLEALDEIFAQNALTSPQDRENTIRTILRGDSLTAFESSIYESRSNPEGPGERQIPLTEEMITKALQAVSQDVFPHRALCHQVRWMQRRMRKPAGMGIRQFIAAISQMNEKLIRFPGATKDDLFKADQLVELAEFALPDSWRAKFDLAGYVPTNFDKYRLIAEGEQIERAAALAKTPKPKKDKSAKNTGKTGSTKNNFAGKGKGNGPHSANAGKVTTKHKGPSKAPEAGKNFSGNKFRKELYALSKGKDRVQVIDQFAAVLKKERAKAVKAKSKSKNSKKTATSTATSSEDSSDSDASVHVMDAEETKKARMRHVFKRLKAKAIAVKKRPVIMSDTEQDEPLEEEKAFIAQVSHDKNPFDTSEYESSSDEDEDMSDVESDTKKTT